jgi:hypothetical protein
MRAHREGAVPWPTGALKLGGVLVEPTAVVVCEILVAEQLGDAQRGGEAFGARQATILARAEQGCIACRDVGHDLRPLAPQRR